MKYLLTILSVVFLVGLMVDSASATVVVPTKKNNVTVCVKNSSNFGNAIAVIIDPDREFRDYFDDGEFDENLFQRDGGQFINRGATGEFKTKAGDHRIVAVDAKFIDDIAIDHFVVLKNQKKVFAAVIGGDPLKFVFGRDIE